tara:strand:+ start:359 stop:649 length:291 start_codon:yes stop_codon:yes gene_type:complete
MIGSLGDENFTKNEITNIGTRRRTSKKRPKNISITLLRKMYISNYFLGLDNSTAMIHPYFPINLFDKTNLSRKFKIGYRNGKIKVFLKGTNAKENK